MKLKLADLMSRAKRVLHSKRSEFDRVGALLRRQAHHAAEECAQLGRKTDWQYHKSLKEFLAFFAVTAVNEIALHNSGRKKTELKQIFEQLVGAICEGPESDRALLDLQLTVRRIITYQRSGFAHWFYGYWNADLEGMRITKSDLLELEERHLPGPTGEYRADAELILLLRVARLENTRGALPPGTILERYRTVVQEEIGAFATGLSELLE